MKALLVQPPFTQLNTPYPAIHYLESFVRGLGIDAASFDHSIALYREIFSRDGLTRIFADARRAAKNSGAALDQAARSQLDRYFSYESLYIQCIDGIVDYLSGKDPAMAHRLARAAWLPQGERCAAFIEELGGEPGAERTRELATKILEDLGDLIAFSLDPDFGTVRYAERLASGLSDFSRIRAGLDDSYIMSVFYGPWLDEFWKARGDVDLLLISIPFPGVLAGALTCARSARRALGDAARIVFGGGYVSTELRELSDPGIFDFCDYLVFDAGYGGLLSIIEGCAGAPEAALYRCMYRGKDGAVARSAGFGDGDGEPRFRNGEARAIDFVFPDYASADFGLYLRCADTANPMHRLWSDAPWLKYRLAYGCYWRRCMFCDTALDYVARFAPADSAALMEAADRASGRSGVFGLHFVDEAMPMRELLAFARLNRERALKGQRPFYFWGNIRFDASWNFDRAALLAASGLVAVSGGIEIASDKGLAATDKGFDLAALVRCLAALKDNGILVHAYLIYGFPGQDEDDIIESADVCRQLFAEGLVDSAFWHRFVLTRHSRMYGLWREGRFPGLRPIEKKGCFADNDMGFAGEELYERFEAPLATSLAAWMEGRELDRQAAWFFGKKTGRPGRNLVARLLAETARDLGPGQRGENAARAFWIAGRPELFSSGGAATTARWAFQGRLVELQLPRTEAETLCAALARASESADGVSLSELRAGASAAFEPGAYELLRATGLVLI